MSVGRYGSSLERKPLHVTTWHNLYQRKGFYKFLFGHKLKFNSIARGNHYNHLRGP